MSNNDSPMPTETDAEWAKYMHRYLTALDNPKDAQRLVDIVERAQARTDNGTVVALAEAMQKLIEDYDNWQKDPLNGGTKNIHDLYEQARAALAMYHNGEDS